MTPSASDVAQLATIRRKYVVLTGLRWFPTGLLIPGLVLLLQERGLGIATIGVLSAIYSATIVSLELPTGGLSDVIGRRPVLLVSAVLAGVSSLVLATGASVWTLGAGYVALAVSRALDSGPLQAWFVDATRAMAADAPIRSGLSRAEVAGSVGLGAGALGAGGLVALSPLPTQGTALIAMSTPFLVSAVMSLVHAGLVWAWIPHPADRVRPRLADVFRDVPATVAAGARLVAGPGVLRRIALLTAGIGVALNGIELLAPTSFAERLGGESAAAGPYSVLVTLGFAGAAGGAALAPVAARLIRAAPRAVLVSAVAGAIAVVGVGLPSFWWAAAAFVVFYIALGVGGPLLDELGHDAVSSHGRATMLSANSMALQGGGMLASIGATALAQATNIAIGLAAIALVLFVAAFAMARWPNVQVLAR
ncbi:MFS transporter [Demequina aurantiaca]|uniref:MFS transporter n=1 Tax=Demequina aurantiaca TaxID=676200 RepID=UPI003D33C6FD